MIIRARLNTYTLKKGIVTSDGFDPIQDRDFFAGACGFRHALDPERTSPEELLLALKGFGWNVEVIDPGDEIELVFDDYVPSRTY